MAKSTGGLKISLGNQKSFQLPLPVLRGDAQKPKVVVQWVVTKTYSKIAGWGPEVALEAKLHPPLDANSRAQLLSQEAGLTVEPSTPQKNHFPFGEVVSYCTPSSGSTCFYFVVVPGEKSELILKGSDQIQIDFSKGQIL